MASDYGVIADLVVERCDNNPIDEDTEFVLYKNDTPTDLRCTILNGECQASDTVHKVSIKAGDEISIRPGDEILVMLTIKLEEEYWLKV
jgi:hypothetical protein